VLTPLGFSLLRQLADGDFHSGEDLAAMVGLTRARVSQALKDAEVAGLALERIKGRGYRLLEAPDFLDAYKVNAALAKRAIERGNGTPLSVEIVDQIDSTSSELLRRMQRRDVHGVVLTAEWQTAGRGRRGRAWTAIAGGSLRSRWAGASSGCGLPRRSFLAVGVAVVRALEAEGFRASPQVAERSRPSAHEDRRHLIEVNGDALGPSTTVIGVGLNVRLPAAARKEIPVPVTDLATVAGRKAKGVDRNRLLAQLIAELAGVLEQYAKEGFAPFAAEWQHRHAYQGKQVTLLLPDGASVVGKVAGVDASGALVLADGPRRARFLSGEISLRSVARARFPVGR
jgi:BirA family biotin operon repressor/biotin-[acetyl-CoA-carboxylase] ligase